MTEKKKAKLENWSKHRTSRYTEFLSGTVYGHHRPDDLPDGTSIYTSELVNLDETNNTAETLNTIYELGKKMEQDNNAS